MTIDYSNFNTKEELYQLIKENPNAYMRQIKAFNKQLFAEVDQLTGKNFGEKMYKYIHGQGYCWRCRCEVGFINVIEGYRNACKKCYEEDRAIKSEMGPPPKCINPECNNAVQEHDKNKRWKEHCSLKCRGVHNSAKSRDKSKKTSLERYGNIHYSATGECKEKVKNTMMERYGTTNIFQIPEAMEKYMKTNLERYGVEWATKNDEVKMKVKAGVLEKYGVSNVSQHPDVHKKKLRRGKKYILDNGVEIDIQGYEGHFIDKIKQCYPVDEKIIDIPTIMYDYDGTTKVYFPDMWLEHYNLLIEVKSTYTVGVENELNAAKIKGTVDAGYNLLYVVIGDNGEFINTMFFNSDIVEFFNSTGYDKLFDVQNGIVAQYVKNDIAINIQHPYFVNELMCGLQHCKEVVERLRATYNDVLLFDMPDVVTNFNVVKNMINFKVGVCEVYYGRKCEVVEVTSSEAKELLNATHLMGFTPCSEYIGLKHDGVLVSVMGFSLPRVGVGSKKENIYELVRFSSIGRVIGGASKMLKYFMDKHDDYGIISYSDNMYSDGGVYETLGFELMNLVRPRYRYIKVGDIMLHHRFKFAKHKLKNMVHYREDLSERDIMLMEGYLRTYDAGKKTWVKENNQL